MNHFISIFAGASEIPEYMDIAYQVGQALGKRGYVTITGGGPGIMRQVNKGAFESGGQSWGICIKHRAEEIIFDYFHHHEIFESFDARNDRLLALGQAFIVLPGGIGTVVEALQITQRKKFLELPINTPLLLVGHFYEPLTRVFERFKEHNIITDDLNDLYSYVLDVPSMMNVIDTFFEKKE